MDDRTACRLLQVPEIESSFTIGAEEVQLALVELPNISVQCIFVSVVAQKVLGEGAGGSAGLDQVIHCIWIFCFDASKAIPTRKWPNRPV